MNELAEILGWANVALFASVVATGLLLRFGGLKASRPAVALGHRVLTAAAVLSLLAHGFLVEDRPWILLVAGGLLAALAVATIVLKRWKKFKVALTLKMVALPVLALTILGGHLWAAEGGEGGPRTEAEGAASHESEQEDD